MSAKKLPQFTEPNLDGATVEELKELVRQYSHIARLAGELYEAQSASYYEQRNRIKTLEFLQGFRFN